VAGGIPELASGVDPSTGTAERANKSRWSRCDRRQAEEEEEEERADPDERLRQDVHPDEASCMTHEMAIEAIRAAYDALGTGDVEPLVSLMDEGMEWGGRRRGWRFWSSASLSTRTRRDP
jgi:hypothetical protein